MGSSPLWPPFSCMPAQYHASRRVYLWRGGRRIGAPPFRHGPPSYGKPGQWVTGQRHSKFTLLSFNLKLAER